MLFLLFSLSSHVLAESHLDNVAYADVIKLTAEPYDNRLMYGSLPSQFIEFYQSKSPRKGIAINIHGGCWLAAFDISHSRPFASALSHSGFDVYNVEYRRTGEGGEWPIALNDVIAALDLVRSQISDSLLPVYLLGHSAGGHLAMLSATKFEWPELKLVGLAPIVDLTGYAIGENSCQSVTKSFMQGLPDETPEKYQAASVLYKSFELNDAPGILVGGADNIVPAEFSQHSGAEIMRIEGAGHFDFIHPQSTAFSKLLSLMTKP